MTAHNHRQHVDGCYRCELSKDEAKAADRTVHCTIVPVGGGRIEIARYDRSGKWWYESGKKRRPLTLAEAVAFAAKKRPAVIWHENLAGGRAFDAAVRRARAVGGE